MKDKKIISEFITNQPLYHKLELGVGFQEPNKFDKTTFKYYCELDESLETFELEAYPNRFSWDLRFPNKGLKHWVDKNGSFNMTQQYKGICKRCNNYYIDIILNSFVIKDKVFLRKIGQYPPIEITPEKYLIKYLNEEDKENYKKALMLLSQSFGIGAFSYLRRIVENEILQIIEDLSNIDFPDSIKIKELLSQYQENHQMTNLIDGIYEYLPGGLKTLGNNPIKVLYSQLSGGIHSFSENECFEKAQQIDTLLKFVIKKINEEQSEVKAAKDAMNKLTL